MIMYFIYCPFRPWHLCSAFHSRRRGCRAGPDNKPAPGGEFFSLPVPGQGALLSYPLDDLKPRSRRAGDDIRRLLPAGQDQPGILQQRRQCGRVVVVIDHANEAVVTLEGQDTRRRVDPGHRTVTEGGILPPCPQCRTIERQGGRRISELGLRGEPRP